MKGSNFHLEDPLKEAEFFYHISFSHNSSVILLQHTFIPRAGTHFVLLGVFPKNPLGLSWKVVIELRSLFSISYEAYINPFIFCVFICCSSALMTAL